MKLNTELNETISIHASLSSIKTDKLKGKPVYAAARTVANIQPIIAAFQKKENEFMAECSGGKGFIERDDGRKLSEFNKARNAELETEIEIEVHAFSLKESECGEGVIPVGSLAVLLRHGIVTVTEATE